MELVGGKSNGIRFLGIFLTVKKSNQNYSVYKAESYNFAKLLAEN